ncbi:MAG: serine protease [Verrucomicrobiota bacterium]
MTTYRSAFFLLTALFCQLAAAQTSAPDPFETPLANKIIFEEPRDGLALLYATRDTYAGAATYQSQGAVRVIKYVEAEGGGGFLFQSEKGPARTKIVKLFTTAFRRNPFAMRHELVNLGLGRSFTTVDFWGPQRHVTDHYSSSTLPMTTESLVTAITENNEVLVNFNPVPDWLLSSIPEIQPIIGEPTEWIDGGSTFPSKVWWIGEENLAGVQTDLVGWRTADDTAIAIWLTRSPVAVVKLMAERKDGTDYTGVTTLIQPGFGKAVGKDLLAINRERPPFFDTDPGTIAFGSAEMPPIPESDLEASATGVVRIDGTPRTSETPVPNEPDPNAGKPRTIGAAEVNDVASLPGSRQSAAARKDQSLLTPDQMKAIVVIEGDQGVGTGFFCNIRGKNFIVTNQHVISGHRRLNIRTVDGEPVEAGEIYGAIGHDIAIISVAGSKGELAAAADVSSDTEIGDRVVVPGNKLGGGVVTQVDGRVLGVGPDRVEIDARFVPGNSGSPIINLDTGEVIGVATYVRKDMPENFAEAANIDDEVVEDGAIIRWFGYRIDSVNQWERIDWSKWQRQYNTIRNFNEDSLAIYYYLANDPEFYNNPTMRRLFDDYVDKMRVDNRDVSYYERETKLFIQRIINFASWEMDEIGKTQFYDYFRSTAGPDTNVTENIKYRERLVNYLQSLGQRWRVLANRVRK